jgi:serine protease Do
MNTRWKRRAALMLAWVLAWMLAPAHAADIEAQSRALQRASDAVLGVTARAVPDARSIATLGPQRQGSGVVIGEDGLVLTIGYLILEAESVVLLTDDGREVPATVVAYDVATGFGLLRPLTPLRLAPVPLGRSGTLSSEEPLVVVSGGEEGAVSGARLVSRRGFSGNWEYHIDGALYTAPARRDHSGAGLFNGRGELVGIGSLWMADVRGDGSARLSGNLFVPVDLLTPVLAEMRARGASRASERAWVGLQCAETGSGLRVLRVNPDSPADVAGVEAGDTIERIDGTAVVTLEAFYKTLWAGGPPERDVTLSVLRAGQPVELTVRTVDRMKTFRRSQGL